MWAHNSCVEEKLPDISEFERADKGFGILFTEQGRVPLYNMLTPMEYGYFTTKPEEVGRQAPSATATTEQD